MAYCLSCHEPIATKISWGSLFLLEEEPVICDDCNHQLEKITGAICPGCGRHDGQAVCVDCIRWEQAPAWQGILSKNRSIYLYNDDVKELLAKFKFRGDYELVHIFSKDMNDLYAREFSSYLVIPVPLSSERLYERGFNQAKALAELLHQPIYEPLSRTHSEKQSKKSRQERLNADTPFSFCGNPSMIRGKSVVLIDDIYTTGTTIRQAAKILKTYGAKKVASLTLARG